MFAATDLSSLLVFKQFVDIGINTAEVDTEGPPGIMHPTNACMRNAAVAQVERSGQSLVSPSTTEDTIVDLIWESHGGPADPSAQVGHACAFASSWIWIWI